MKELQEFWQILRAYTAKNEQPVIPLPVFSSFLARYLAQSNDFPALKTRLGSDPSSLVALLKTLQGESKVNLIGQGETINQIVVTTWFGEKIEREMKRILVTPEVPFPNEDRLKIIIPSELVEAVDVKSELINVLGENQRDSRSFVRLVMPDGMKSIILTPALVQGILMEAVIQKIRNYLRLQKNAAYISQKLRPFFRNRETFLVDMIKMMMIKPDQVLREFKNLTELGFYFWTQFSSILTQEFGQKKEKTDEEQGLAQAACLLGMFCMHYKSQLQKKQEQENLVKYLEASFQKRPYYFTLAEVMNFKDKQGILLTKRLDRAVINDFITKKTTARDDLHLPDMLRIRVMSKAEYLILVENVIKILHEGLSRAEMPVRDDLKQRWTAALRRFEKLPEMSDENAFDARISETVIEHSEVAHSLYNFNLLFLVREQVKLEPQESELLQKILDIKKRAVIPYRDYYGLSQQGLLSDIKMMLPFWMVIPVLSNIIAFFMKPRPKKAKPAEKAKATPNQGQQEANTAEEPSPVMAKSRKAQEAEYKENVQELAKVFSPGKELKKSMAELVNVWNPLLDSTARANLVEDVNSLVRDFLRTTNLLKSLMAPDATRIRNIASRLSENQVFEKIRKKEALREYIELYIIAVLLAR